MPHTKVHRGAREDRLRFRDMVIIKCMYGSEVSAGRDVICRSSQTLSRAFSGAATKTKHFPELSCTALEIYINWLYTGILRTQADTDSSYDAEYDNLVDCFVLGNQIQDKKYRDVIVSAMFEKAQELRGQKDGHLPSDLQVANIYSDAKLSALKKVVVEIYARESDQGMVNVAIEDGNMDHEFMQDLIASLMELRGKAPAINVCKFHEHEGEDCGAQEPARKRRRQD